MSTQFAFGCAICGDAFDEFKRVRATRCGHVYHELCLSKWVSTQIREGRNTNCPKCRASLLQPPIRLFLQSVPVVEVSDTESASDIDSDVSITDGFNDVVQISDDEGDDNVINVNDDNDDNDDNPNNDGNDNIPDNDDDVVISEVIRYSTLETRMNYLHSMDRQLNATFNDIDNIRGRTEELSSNLHAIQRLWLNVTRANRNANLNANPQQN